MHAVGRGLLLVALVLGALSAGSAAAAARNEDPSLQRLARRGVYAVWACVLGASALLLHFLVTHDFSNLYVIAHSDAHMPLPYLISSFWAGQEGSMLLWALVLTSLAALAALSERDSAALRTRAIAVWMGVFLVVDLVLLFADPFEQLLVLGAMPDGEGLDPLLKSPSLTFHPPTILAGYALWAIPLGYGVAALLSPDLERQALLAARPWALAGWLLLTLGNLFGACWASEEPGGGGPWGQDPVASASLLLWLTATPLLHSLQLRLRRGLLGVWTHGLLHATFALAILGACLARAGLARSARAAGSGDPLTVTLLATLGLALLLSTSLLLWRTRLLRSGPRIDSWLSREGALVAANVAFAAAAAVVLWSTLLPAVSGLLTGPETTLGPAWLDRFVGPGGGP